MIRLLIVCTLLVFGATGDGDNIFKDPLANKDHIYEHLAEKIGKKKESEMTPEELQFHYFKLHDYDDNHQLDGNEIAKAITHYQSEADHGSSHEEAMSDEKIAELIDAVLKDSDMDQDGLIAYHEYLREIRHNPSTTS